jgi:hypothetical protein
MASPDPATTDWVPVWDLHTMSGAMPTGGAAAQVLSKNSATNYDVNWVSLSGATLQSGLLNPAGTSSTTDKMMGMGSTVQITPVRTGKLLIVFTGFMKNSNAGGNASAGMWYGTGTPPTNGAAPTGTQILVNVVATSSTALAFCPFNMVYLLSGLTLNQLYWIDLVLSNGTTIGTATVQNVTATLIELP